MSADQTTTTTPASTAPTPRRTTDELQRARRRVSGSASSAVPDMPGQLGHR